MKLIQFYSQSRALILWGIALFLLTACATQSKFEDVYQVIAPATLKPGDSIPLPQGEPMLTVTGKVGAANSEQTILMDRATLEQTGTVEYTVTDPFEERPVQYQGILMRDLLALWQVPDDAETAHVVALNDYTIDIPLEDFRTYPVLFALQADGTYMEPDYRGPAMMVYPVDSYEFDPMAVQRKWIWQIKAIAIE